MLNSKAKTAILSILSNSVLIVMKVIVGVMTASVSIISEAIHSSMDLIAAIIAFWSVNQSDNPPDKEHPYGHGKIENISGVLEAVLIFVAAALIIKEAVRKLLASEPIASIGIGFVVMFISAIINFFVSRRLYKVAKEQDSIALAADALHLKIDVYTSVGVGLGLFLIWITDLHFLDPVVAIGIALIILKEAHDMLKRAYNPLIDASLTDNEIATIKEIIQKNSTFFIDFHSLRTRRSGKFKNIDLHLTIPYDRTIKETHDVCDKIETEIEKTMGNTNVLIHAEPCTQICGDCRLPKDKFVCQT